jgi:hypothetical protein
VVLGTSKALQKGLSDLARSACYQKRRLVAVQRGITQMLRYWTAS